MAELDFRPLLGEVALLTSGAHNIIPRRHIKLVLGNVTILAANRLFRDWFGMADFSEPVVLRGVLQRFTIATSLALTQQLVRVVRGESVRGDGLTLKNREQESRRVRVALSPLEDGRCMVTLNDVTPEVTAQLAWAENELLVQALLHGVTETLSVVDVERQSVALVSPNLASLLGYESEEMVGLRWSEILAPDSAGQGFPRVAADTGALKAHLDLCHRDGDLVPVVAQFERVLLPMPRDMVRVRFALDTQLESWPTPSTEETRRQLDRSNELLLLHQRRARMLRDLAMVAHQANQVLDLLERCLPVLASIGGWPFARLVANNGSALVGLDIWHGDVDIVTREVFESRRMSLDSRIGRGLVQTRSARWNRVVQDLNEQPEPARKLLASGRGWVPIAIDEKVDYAVELLGQPKHAVSVHTLQALREAAEQIGMTVARIRAEANLRSQEEQTRAAFEYSPIASLHLDGNGCILASNQAAVTMLAPNGDPSELVQKVLYDFVAEEDMVQAAVLLDYAIEHSEGANAELRIVARDGRRLIANTSVSVVATDGTMRQLVVGLDDITDLKNAEVELRLTEQRFRTVFEHAMHGIGMFGTNGEIYQMNARLGQLLGTGGEAVDNITELIVDQSDDTWNDAWGKARRGYPARFELNMADGEGRDRILDVTLQPVTGDGGQVEVLVGSATDITAVRRALAERDKLLQAMSERMHELQCLYAVAVSAQEGGTTAQMLQRASTVMGRKWPADNRARLRITYRDLQLHVGTDGVERNPTLGGGEDDSLVVDLIDDETASHNHSDFQSAIYRILHLAAQRQRTEEELRAAREQAEVASRAKSTFLAHVSHEIRTPMNAILGFAQLLNRDANLSEEQRGRVERILRAGDHLTSLINGVLEISKIESGHVRLETEPIELPRLLEDVGAMFAARAAEKGLEFVFSTTSLPSTVKADPGKLRQILINLIGNAVKFTSEGFVAVEVDHLASRSGIYLRCSVSDSGPGIPPEDIERIFERFESGNDWAHTGTGLGLSICREYTQLMGGTLTVESTLGEGTTFRLNIPIELIRTAPKTSQVKPVTPRGVELMRALVVDDNADNREVLTEMLRGMGMTSHEAVDGQKAVEACSNDSFNLVFMDLSMPVMGGIEAIRRIRDMPNMRRAKFVVVSARAFDQDRRSALDAGADAFLGKPFTAEQLGAVLSALAGKESVSGSFRRITKPVKTSKRRLKVDPQPFELSSALIDRCVQAAHDADVAALDRLIEEVGREHVVAAAQLRALSDGFDYDGIVKLATQWRDSHSNGRPTA